MAKKLKELFTSLAKKAGLDLTKPEFKDVLASDMEVPDELFDGLETKLMHEDAALNNSKVRNQIRAEVYNGIDSEFASSLEEYELADDVKAEILAEKKTLDRVKKLAATLRAQAAQAAKDGDKPAAEALKKQVDELNNQIKTVKEQHKKEIDELKVHNEKDRNVWHECVEGFKKTESISV